jgi:L-malate glycosyltransferase
MARRPTIALVWAQFAAYHGDRAEAVARRLAGRAEVLAIEIASASHAYAWEESGALATARKQTLFPGRRYEDVPALARVGALWRALRRCDRVVFGIGYDRPEAIALSWLLPLVGVKVALFSESKFDDFPRSARFELTKALLLTPYRAAIVGGLRHIAYFRHLGFRRRPVLPGYNGASLARLRTEAGGVVAPDGVPFAERPFVYVGRFIAKKNLIALVEAHAAYAAAAGPGAGRLVLAGAGPEEAALRARIAALGTGHLVDFPGFLGAREVSALLAGALALVLVSTVEQWGLVVNEAAAFGVPAIVSQAVGARDALVRNLVNGYVVEPQSVAGIARAMALVAGDEAHWRELVAETHARAWLGDTERLADAVELWLDPGAQPAEGRMADFVQALGEEPVKGEA